MIWRKRATDRIKSFGRKATVSLIWTHGLPVFILLVAAALRLIGLRHGSPPGIEHDEVANWLIDRSILAGNHAIYFTQAYGHEAGFHYLQASFVALLGDHVLTLRLPAAFAGLLLVAATHALTHRLFGRPVALIAAAITAVLFWPVFYSRLGLRAITLPLLAALAAYFWWGGWQASEKENAAPRPTPYAPFFLAGLFAGLSLYTYMAARAVPIFYGLFTVYLALLDWRTFKMRWRGVVLFWLVYTLVAGPFVIYLLTHPGAEFRVSEVDAPLRALLAGDLRPVLSNAVRILVGFGGQGDPLWRQNVAGRSVFEPVGAILFYAGLLWVLGHWRTPKYGFVLLWLATSVIPSLVTVDAPSTIRMIHILPVLSIPISLVIHKIGQFSTKTRHLSTKLGYLCLGLLLTAYIWGTAVSIFHTWPGNDEVRYVWQTAFTDIGAYLDETATIKTAAIAGWSPDTMDLPTMTLLLRREDAQLSYFSPLDGTLLLPSADQGVHHLFRPAILEFDAAWETWLTAHNSVVQAEGEFVHYTVPDVFPIEPQHPADVLFGDQLRFIGYDMDVNAAETTVVTYWRVVTHSLTPARLFIQALDVDGVVVGDDYHWDTADPQELWQPHWQPGDLILQRHTFTTIPEEIQLRLGIFNPYTCEPGPCQNLVTETGTPFIIMP